MGLHRHGSSGMRLRQESLIGFYRRGSSGMKPHQESEPHLASSTWQQWGEASPRECHRGFVDVSTRHIYQHHGTTSTVARRLELRYGGIVRTSRFSVVVQSPTQIPKRRGFIIEPYFQASPG